MAFSLGKAAESFHLQRSCFGHFTRQIGERIIKHFEKFKSSLCTETRRTFLFLCLVCACARLWYANNSNTIWKKQTNKLKQQTTQNIHSISAPCLDPQRQTFSFLYLSKVEIKKIPRKTTATRSRVESAKENHPDKWRVKTQGKRKSKFFWFGLLTHRFHPMQNFHEKIKDISFKGLKRCNFCLQLRLQKIVATGTSKSSSCRYLTGCFDNQVTNWRMGRDRNLKLTSSSFTYFKE